MTIDDDLLDSIVTQSDADDFIYKLDQLSKEIYIGEDPVTDKVSNLMNSNQKKILMESLKRNKVSESDVNAIETVIELLKTAINKQPHIQLILSYEFPVENLISISKWFRLNSGKSVLLDIQIDSNIVGGAIVLYKGRQGDFSLKNKLNQILQDDEIRKSILSSIKNT